MKKYLIELDVNDGEWKDDMDVQCDSFEYINDATIKANGAIIRIPNICNITSYKEII